MEKSIPAYFDVFPKVVAVGKPVQITIRPLADPGVFPADKPVELHVLPLQQRVYAQDDTPRGHALYTLARCEDGCLRFTHSFAAEQEHYLRVRVDDAWVCQLSVYAVAQDLVGMIPLYGDQHVHTTYSDGHEQPAFVAAEFRMHGFDYAAITDHSTMAGALEAIETFKGAPMEMHLMMGEEVHLPDCGLHVVHIGGRWSVNARVQSQMERMQRERPGMRARFPQAWEEGAGGGFPGTMADDVFRRMIWDEAEKLDIPEGLPRFTYAGFRWICNEIRNAGGLAIFPHPYWLADLFHADERLTAFILRSGDFDAFEVLGGESYLEQNGFQTAHYYEMRAQGYDFPIVGSSDSHANYNNPNAHVASTITFARANDTPSILEAIRAKRTVAVDWISAEPRLVGSYRLVKYAQFLLENYFPIHASACYEEGRAMKAYACGEREEGLRMLRATNGRIGRLWQKYFAF